MRRLTHTRTECAGGGNPAQGPFGASADGPRPHRPWTRSGNPGPHRRVGGTAGATSHQIVTVPNDLDTDSACQRSYLYLPDGSGLCDSEFLRECRLHRFEFLGIIVGPTVRYRPVVDFGRRHLMAVVLQMLETVDGCRRWASSTGPLGGCSPGGGSRPISAGPTTERGWSPLRLTPRRATSGAPRAVSTPSSKPEG